MTNYYCEYCGRKFPSVRALTNATCLRHPDGKGKCKLYEGSEKSKYTCKYCGRLFSTLTGLTGATCLRHPSGKGKCAPAL